MTKPKRPVTPEPTPADRKAAGILLLAGLRDIRREGIERERKAAA